MDIKNLETFVMVNELKNFTQAAEKLGYTQSTVSFQIRQLETELGTPLFERINHKVTLTTSGQKLLPIAHNMLKMAAEAMHVSSDTSSPRGVVRIAIAESLSSWQLRHHFFAFHEKYPDVHLNVISASTDIMFELLEQNRVDLVYTLDKKIANSKYHVAFEAPVQVYFVAKKDHPLAREKAVSIHDVLSYPMLLTEKDMSYRAILDETLARQGMETDPLIEVGDTHLISNLLHQGIGISCLPFFTVQDDIDAGLLSQIHISDIDIQIWRQLIYHRNKWISPELQCVIDFFQD